MCDRVERNQPPDPLDHLIDKLMASGGVFSQIIHHMLEFEHSPAGSDELAAVLEVAHSLVRSVMGGVGERHSLRDIRIASSVVDDVTNVICEEVFLYSAASDEDEASTGERRRES
jgi:hypothetical protein